jgi:glycerol-3-phosphate acyltransferase PlsY
MGTVGLALAIVAVGYLLGSIPTANIVMRRFRNKDLRQIGTGSVTSTAVMIHGGRLPGSISLAGEIIKTFLCLYIAYLLVGELWAYLVMLIAASLGQIWSVWLKWAGGRGQTIFATGFMVLCPIPFLISVAFLAVIFFTTKRFLLSNQLWHLFASPLLLLALLFNPTIPILNFGEHSWGYAATSAVLCGFFLVKHRAATDDIVTTQAWGAYSR